MHYVYDSDRANTYMKKICMYMTLSKPRVPFTSRRLQCFACKIYSHKILPILFNLVEKNMC